MERYDVIIVGTGPAGLGTAFDLLEKRPSLKILLMDALQTSSGGLRNDCKMNFTWPIGFPFECWDERLGNFYLERVETFLKPRIMEKRNINIYGQRAEKIGVTLLDVRQSHLGTDGGLELIHQLIARLSELGAEISLGEEMTAADASKKVLFTTKREIAYDSLLVAPGRSGFAFLQRLMEELGVQYHDNVVDIGIRVETREEHYPIVRDYYDPKFLFPKKTRTFCTNSRSAHVVQERYGNEQEGFWYSVNGHAWSEQRAANGLVNFAILKTVTLTQPLASGQKYAQMLGRLAALLGGGRPIMQRIGDFRLGKRSFADSFTGDLYDFQPTLASCTPGDLSLCVPAKTMRAI